MIGRNEHAVMDTLNHLSDLRGKGGRDANLLTCPFVILGLNMEVRMHPLNVVLDRNEHLYPVHDICKLLVEVNCQWFVVAEAVENVIDDINGCISR